MVMEVVVDGLTGIKEAVTELAFARAGATEKSPDGFIQILDGLDGMIDRWAVDEADLSPDDYYRLGLMVGMLAYMSACRVDGDGQIVPMDVLFPMENPVARAAAGIRSAVLAFTTSGDLLDG